jgi:hypothetical protein
LPAAQYLRLPCELLQDRLNENITCLMCTVVYIKTTGLPSWMPLYELEKSWPPESIGYSVNNCEFRCQRIDLEESRRSQCVFNQIQKITAAENAPRSAAWCVPHHGLRTYPASFTLKNLKIDHADTGLLQGKEQRLFADLLMESHAVAGSLHLSGCLIRSDLGVLKTHLICKLQINVLNDSRQCPNCTKCSSARRQKICNFPKEEPYQSKLKSHVLSNSFFEL